MKGSLLFLAPAWDGTSIFANLPPSETLTWQFHFQWFLPIYLPCFPLNHPLRLSSFLKLEGLLHGKETSGTFPLQFV